MNRKSICRECSRFMVMSYIEENSGETTPRMVCLESSLVFVCTQVNPIARDEDGYPLVVGCNKLKPMSFVEGP